MSGTSTSDEEELKGHVDDKRRPVARLFFYDTKEDHLALLDTGCLFAVVADQKFVDDARLPYTGITTPGILANGKRCKFAQYEASIHWLGRKKTIGVFLPLGEESEQMPSYLQPRDRERSDDPKLMLGVGLLDGHHLSVDFKKNRLKISHSK